MSDHSREQLFVATTTTTTKRNLSLSSRPGLQQESPQLASEHESGHQKLAAGNLLTSPSTASKYLSVELNNNSIVQQQPSSSSERATGNLLASDGHKMMNQATVNKQQQPARKPESKLTAANGSLASGAGNTHTPSYSSIFASPSYNRSISPPQEIQQQHNRPQKTTQLNLAARRGSKLQKQEATDSLEVPRLLSLDRSLARKKLSNFEFADRGGVKRADDEDDDDVHDDDYEDEDEDYEIESQDNNLEGESDDLANEKQPFKSSSGLAKLKHSKGHKSGSLANHHQSQRCQLLSSKEANKKLTSRCAEPDAHRSPYTKISFGESRPPSFGTCQAAFSHYHHHEAAPNGVAKLDGWQFPVQCNRCDCSKCTKKSKTNDKPGCSTIQMDPYVKTYTRTKSLHLVLKSIILVLLTLLLLMMFIGIIMASHYLPSVFDRVLNATRSFNVTIAG